MGGVVHYILNPVVLEGTTNPYGDNGISISRAIARTFNRTVLHTRERSSDSSGQNINKTTEVISIN
jgi:hypothetical protein